MKMQMAMRQVLKAALEYKILEFHIKLWQWQCKEDNIRCIGLATIVAPCYCCLCNLSFLNDEQIYLDG